MRVPDTAEVGKMKEKTEKKILEWSCCLLFVLTVIFIGYVFLDELGDWEPDAAMDTETYSQQLQEQERRW